MKQQLQISDGQRVAFFGIPGSFTHLAAERYFGEGDFRACAKFRDVFDSVANNEAAWGVVPIENTLAGSIYENYDLLAEYKLRIVGEVRVRIEHALLVSAKSKVSSPDEITKVFSHQKALEQCGVFLRSHPTIQAVPFDDTATAAKHVSEQGGDTSWAAIAHPRNAELYNLVVLEPNIEDTSFNFTRFIVVAKDEGAYPAEANKYSLLLQLPHVPGSLSAVLSYLSDKKVNLTKIESRPLPDKPFEYIFYVDITLPANTDSTTLLTGLEKHVQTFDVLGFYVQSA